ncbi:LysR family transcriptional regulator [Tistrella mobilis]|uniref:LysR family transcriptional regulator n=1 Tax=Tistrella mobilis TaxID=171437 RepID=UPI0035571DBF
MTDKLRQFCYAITASESKSFRRAAEILQVRQSSISRGIRNLEDELGVSLFERSHKGVRLTDAGDEVLQRLRPALEQIEVARKTATEFGTAKIGTVRVGISTSVPNIIFHEIVKYYADKHPLIEIDFCSGRRQDHITAIREHRIDIAIVLGDGQVRDCETKELWRERINVILPERHPLTASQNISWSELVYETIVVSNCAIGWELYEYIVNHKEIDARLQKIVPRSVVIEALLSLVSWGQGLAIISEGWKAIEVPGIVSRPLKGKPNSVPFSIVWSPRNDNPALRRFIGVAQKFVGSFRCELSCSRSKNEVRGARQHAFARP